MIDWWPNFDDVMFFTVRISWIVSKTLASPCLVHQTASNWLSDICFFKSKIMLPVNVIIIWQLLEKSFFIVKFTNKYWLYRAKTNYIVMEFYLNVFFDKKHDITLFCKSVGFVSFGYQINCWIKKTTSKHPKVYY